MKELVKGFFRWFLIILTTLTLIVWASIFWVYCQEHPKHESQEDVEETVRYTTVQYLSNDKRLIYWKKETKYRVIMSSFGYDKYTRFEGKMDRVCILYCQTHLFAYLVVECKGG